MRDLINYLIVFFLAVNGFSQREYPAYHSPLKIPLILAGNFGELRPNHFHMGVDFKTQGKEGFELHAIEDGFVSRVKVSTYGYGKAVYIDHPNGKTSVYAHCSKFTGLLDSLVKAEQYRTENFEVELFFKPNDVVLKKGDVFALSGNTGGSTAPHLHFEIRDTKTEHAQNPLVYAFDLSDTRAPEIRKLRAYGLNEQGYLIPGKVLEKPVIVAKQGYVLTGDTLKLPADFCSNFGGVGFSFDIIDRLNGAENQCGLYGTFLIVDGDTLFGQRTDEISFFGSRYINSHRDLNAAGQFHKSFRNSSNPLEIYINDKLGVLSVQPGESKQVRLEAYDPKGNKSVLTFVLSILPGNKSPDFNPLADKYWYPDESFTRKHENWEVFADSFSIYEPYELSKTSTPHICDVATSLQKKITIKMKLESPKLPVEKYYISVSTKGGKKALSTTYSDGWLTAKTNNSGTFSIQTDEVSPVIKPISTSLNVITKIVKFSISDSQSGLSDCDLFIDGVWYLLEYEHKGKYAFFEVPVDLKGLHQIKIVAKDECGNLSVWEKELNFK